MSEEFKMVIDRLQQHINLAPSEFLNYPEGELRRKPAPGKWSKKEFSYQAFNRSFHLSDKINTDSITAEYQDGILHIQLPKKEEAKAKPAKLVVIK